MSRSLSLGNAASGVLFVIEDLPVEIMQLRAVMIGDSNKTDTRPNEQNSNEGPERAEAGYENTGLLDLLLALLSNHSQELMPTISRNLRFHVATVVKQDIDATKQIDFRVPSCGGQLQRLKWKALPLPESACTLCRS